MSESEPKPSENKPAESSPPAAQISPNRKAIEDLSWEIPGGQTIYNFFVREGKVVRDGWMAVLVIIGLTAWLTHSCTKESVSDDLRDVKSERDKYQIMLAPYQAADLKLKSYTNEPLTTPIVSHVEPAPAPAPTPSSDPITTKQIQDVAQDEADVTNFAQVKARKADEEAREREAAKERVLKIHDENWKAALSIYRYSLTSLHDQLLQEALRQGDGIAQPEDYFQSLPDKLNVQTGAFDATEIRMRNNTNISFTVSVSEARPQFQQQRQLRISCKAGYLETTSQWGDFFDFSLHIAPNFDHSGQTNRANANKMLSGFVRELILGQVDYLANTNSNNVSQK